MNGYTLIGFSGHLLNVGFDGSPDSQIRNGRTFASIPIYLPNREIQGSLYSRLPSANAMSIILSELYKVKWVHGKLDIIDLLKDGYIKLYDENEVELMFGAPPATATELNVWINEINPRIRHGNTRKDVINFIEQKYTGLFTSEFINIQKSQPPIDNSSSIQNKKIRNTKQVRDSSLTKKYRNQRASKFPDWWTKSEE